MTQWSKRVIRSVGIALCLLGIVSMTTQSNSNISFRGSASQYIAKNSIKLSIQQDVDLGINRPMRVSADSGDDQIMHLPAQTRLLLDSSILVNENDMFLNFEPER